MSFFSQSECCLSFLLCVSMAFFFKVFLCSSYVSLFCLQSLVCLFNVCLFLFIFNRMSESFYCLFEYFSMLMSTLIYSFIRCLSLLFGWVMIFCLSLRQTVIYALVLVSLKLCYGLLAFLCHFFSFCTCLFDCRSLICLSSCLFCLFNCLSFNVVSVCLTLFVCLKFLHWKLQQASW